MVHSVVRSLLRAGTAALVVAALVAFGALQGTFAQESSEIVVPINELNGSGVSGDATLTDNGDGTTTIDVLVDGAVGDHPIHLHSGTCAELGDVVVPLTDVDADGSSVTDVPMSLADLQDPTQGPFAINIHLSADEIDTYVACGDIPLAEAAVGGETETDTTATGGETDSSTAATTTPATGVGSTVAHSNSLLALAGMMAAGLLFLAGFGLRRSEARI